jgi:hypothetical protein
MFGDCQPSEGHQQARKAKSTPETEALCSPPVTEKGPRIDEKPTLASSRVPSSASVARHGFRDSPAELRGPGYESSDMSKWLARDVRQSNTICHWRGTRPGIYCFTWPGWHRQQRMPGVLGAREQREPDHRGEQGKAKDSNSCRYCRAQSRELATMYL